METPDKKENSFQDVIIQVCGVLAAVTGLVALLGWITGHLLLASFGATVPMAPSTALLFILYGSAVFSRVRKPQSRMVYLSGMYIGSAGTLAALLLFFLSYLGIHLSVEHLGIPISGAAGGVPIGHMSPLTALCFVLVGFSFLAALSSTPDSPRRAIAAFGLACLIILTSFVLLIAYLLGTPLIYSRHFILPALSTSLAFIVLGIALLVFAGQRAWSKSARVEPVDKRAANVLILVFVILAVGIISAGYFYYRSYEKQYRVEVERQLSAIAELKADELVDWREERVRDASIFFKNAAFTTLVRRYFENPQDMEAIGYLRSWLGNVQAYQYDRVFLLDARGVVRMSVPDKSEPVAPHLLQNASETLRSGQVTFLDFHRDAPDRPIHLAVLVPVLNVQNGSRATGLLVLRIDPQKYLYPFINRWPTPSLTAETLLIRRDGNEAVFLNELKFKKNTALNLRISLEKQEELPAVKAVLGQQGIVEGKDYRGVPVIAYVRSVPNSPWFLVARMDASEGYTSLRERLWEIVILIGALLICAGAGVGFVWRHQRTRYYRERYEAAEALRASEERYHSLVENVGIGISLISPNMEILALNKQMKTWFPHIDVSSRPICYKSFNDPPREEICSYCPTVKTLQDGQVHEAMTETPAKDKVIFFRVISSPLKDQDGKIIAAIEMVEDFTERKRVEEALRESEEEYHSLFEDTKDVVYISTIEGKYLDINPAGVELFGYDSKEELLKVDIAKDLYLNPYDRKKFIQVMEQQGFAKDYERLMRRKDGEILTVLVTAIPSRDKEGKIIEFRGIMRDVTQQRKLEQQLIRAQKMEAVGQLAGGIAHDFNNILQAIIGYGSLLEMKMSKDDPLRHNADQILASSERASSLTHSLLAFSRKQIMNLQPVKINEIVKRVEKLLLRIIGEDIELRTFLASEDLTIMADSGQIEQVLMNLATNAKDAMPKGGSLTIETEIVKIDEEYIKTHGYGKPGIYALISVTDTGEGMDEKTKEKIFEPFFTTKEFGKGTGLGLAMVYGIIKQHNGYINVYSEPGRGTTFKLYLPLTEEKVIEVKPTEPPVAIGGTETILFAEDDADVRKFTKAVLEEFGYTVIEAMDGGDAINKFMENRDKIKILILDVVMPKKNGREVYEEIKKTRPDIKVLFMSGYTANVIHKQGIIEEGLDFVLKPISPTVLLRKIRKVLEK